jgi:hypothetical protein
MLVHGPADGGGGSVDRVRVTPNLSRCPVVECGVPAGPGVDDEAQGSVVGQGSVDALRHDWASAFLVVAFSVVEVS